MGTTRMLILAVAAIAAIALAFIVRGMMGQPAPAQAAAAPVAAPKPMAKVLVAARDLPIGTRLAPEDLTWMPWPVEALNVSFITEGSVGGGSVSGTGAAVTVTTTAEKGAKPGKAEKLAAEQVAAAGDALQAARAAIMNDPGGPIVALTGAIVKEPVFANEPITDRKLVRAGQSGYLAVVLNPGMRAMAIPVSVETAAGGFILPGDRVDVLLSRQLAANAGGNNQFISQTVMRNVRVLAVDQTSTAVPGANAVVGAVATIEVSPTDAEALNLAQAQGDLSLTLRSYADITGPTGRVDRPVYTGGGGGVASAPRPIRVWRGGESSEVATPQASSADVAAAPAAAVAPAGN